jgi:hypothetical protein
VHENDTGWYECQISTDPPHSYAVHLNIISKLLSKQAILRHAATAVRLLMLTNILAGAKAKIRGRGEILVNLGSSLTLLCEVEKAMSPLQFILWYHGNRVINYDDRQGLNIIKFNRYI